MSKDGPLPPIQPIQGQPSPSYGPSSYPPTYEESSSPNTGQPPIIGQQPIISHPPPSSQVIVTQVLQPVVLGPQPSTVICPSCHAQVTSKMEIKNSTRTHLLALTICVICFPLACLPYCMDSCKTKNHYCPNCGAYLGYYEN